MIDSVNPEQQASISTLIDSLATLPTAPTITSESAVNMDENIGENMVVYTAETTSTLTNPVFSFIGDLSIFSFDAANGEVRLIGDPDFETLSGYSFSISLTDEDPTNPDNPVTVKNCCFSC